MESFTIASFSQVDIDGAEQACTVIAVLACCLRLWELPLDIEWCIKQSVWIYQKWQECCGSQSVCALPHEVINILRDSFAMLQGEEHGGLTWTDDDDGNGCYTLPQLLLEQMKVQYPATLTIGAFTVALLSDHELLDSHPHENYENKAVLFRFDSCEAMVDHLRVRYPQNTEYSLCSISKALFKGETVKYNSFKDASSAAAANPLLGILKGPEEEYVVGGLEVLYHFQKEEIFYSRRRSQVTFGAVIQYSRSADNPDQQEFLEIFKTLIAKEWKEAEVMDHFIVTDYSVEIMDTGEDEEEEDDGSGSMDTGESDMDDDDIFFRLDNDAMEFASESELVSFLEQLESLPLGGDRKFRWVIPDDGFYVVPRSWDLPKFILTHLGLQKENAKDKRDWPPIFIAIAKDLLPRKAVAFKFDRRGLVTFIMDGGQGEVVADLKQKAFVDKKNNVIAKFSFVRDISMADTKDLMEGNILDCKSSTGQMIVGFADAIFSPNFKISTKEFIKYDGDKYQMSLEQLCKKCGNSSLEMEVTRSKLVIRCRASQCVAVGARWMRPSTPKQSWDLSFLFPAIKKLPMKPETALQVVDCFMQETNFIVALDALEGNSDKDKLKHLEDWANQENNEEVLKKVFVVSKILTDRLLKACYEECLVIAPDFVYPVTLIPQGPCTLALALWMHVGKFRGYKRTDGAFYVPVEDNKGRMYYRTVPIDTLVTEIFHYSKTPNLYATLMFKGRIFDELKRMLRDESHFPSITLSKRYLGFANGVFDLVANDFLSWDMIKKTADAIPFNYIDQELRTEDLTSAKDDCPKVTVKNGKILLVGGKDFAPTPLLDKPLQDQGFSQEIIWWLYVFLGRMFHYIGKSTGDNWETVLFLIGTSGAFKSSLINLLKCYFQPSQFGLLALKMEPLFPLASVIGKLVATNTECGGCTIDTDLFKQMASGDPVAVNAKYKNATAIQEWEIPTIFAGNSFLNVLDRNGSIERRSVVFPFSFRTMAGQDDTGLVSRIFKQEGPMVLIKWNTLYLAVRNAIHTSIHPMLPEEILTATRQAIIEKNDSLRAFLAQECIVTGHKNDRIQWLDVWKRYQSWCSTDRKQVLPIDFNTIEAQSMLHNMGIRLSKSRKHPLALVGIRYRSNSDPPFRSVFIVKSIRKRTNDDDLSDSSSGGEE